MTEYDHSRNKWVKRPSTSPVRSSIANVAQHYQVCSAKLGTVISFCADFVGSAITDADGNFHIQFTQNYFRELFIDREPDLYFKIFKGGQLIASTEDFGVMERAGGCTGG